MKQEERVKQTKNLMASSLKKLMRKKPLSKITINDIVNDCNLNRKTFYYHFDDIYDLLKWMLNEEAVKIVSHFDLVKEYEDAINFIMDYVEENDYILNCIYDTVGHDHLKMFFYNDFIDLVKKIIIDIARMINVQTDDKFLNFLAEFYTGGLVNILIDWIKDPGIFSRQETSENVLLIFRETVPAILKARYKDPDGK